VKGSWNSYVSERIYDRETIGNSRSGDFIVGYDYHNGVSVAQKLET
jgi:hypothetical protein